MFGEESVESTNDDATMCKRSTVQRGYYQDPFLQHFGVSGAVRLCTRRLSSSSSSSNNTIINIERKAPEIHLGYFTRVTGIQTLLEKAAVTFGRPVQILNLGCGYDTLYWRLKAKADPDYQIRNFIDIDFPRVTANKCFMITKSKDLLDKIVDETHDDDDDIRLSKTDLHGPSGYHVIAADFTSVEALERKLLDCGIDYSLPTILIAECVLIYVDPFKCSTFLNWVSNKFQSPVFIHHEQLNMGDRFGQVMLNNLRSRGTDLPGIEACLSHQTQIDRFLRCGWNGCRTWTMNEVYNEFAPEEISRVEKLEHLDERELMSQLFEHYCLAVAWKNSPHLRIEWDDIDWWN